MISIFKRLADAQPWLILAVLSIIWGSSYILIKRSLESFSPIQVACLRVCISALAFAPILIKHLPTVKWRQLPMLFAVGLFGSALPALLFSTAQTHISSSLASILNSLTPIFTLVLGLFFFGRLLVVNQLMGILLGLAGATVILVLGAQINISVEGMYPLLVLVASMCYALNGNLIAGYLRGHSTMVISAVSFFLVGIPMLGLLFSTDFLQVMRGGEAWVSFIYVAVLALVGTVFATVIFFWLIRRTSAVYASTISYIVPAVGISWGLLDGEIVTWWHVCGLLLVLTGVYLVGKKST